MIVEGILGIFFNVFRTLSLFMESVSLPYQFINVLTTILSYGIWIVGADIFAIFLTTIVTWWGIKLAAGLIIWIWELIPLT